MPDTRYERKGWTSPQLDSLLWASLDRALMDAHEKTSTEVPDEVEQALNTVLGFARANHEVPIFRPDGTPEDNPLNKFPRVA